MVHPFTVGERKLRPIVSIVFFILIYACFLIGEKWCFLLLICVCFDSTADLG